jgi:hypothetical protein
MQNWNDLIRTQLDNLASFPPKQTWMLGEWIGECAVRPEAANFAALPLVGNEVGDVRVSLADQAWYIWDGAAWQSMSGGGGGAVNSVTASGPLASSGGANPNISLTGIVAPANGGTGIALPGALNNVLTSDGAGGWTSSAPSGGTVTGVTATGPLASSGGATPDISLTGIVAPANGGTGIALPGALNNVLTSDGAGGWTSSAPSGGATAQGGANAIQYANAATPANFDGNANFVYDEATGRLGVGTATPNEAATINGVVSIAEGASPSNTAAFGKLWANSAADARPYWTDDTGQSYNLTLDRFNTLTPAASVAIDTSPALPVFNSIALNQNTTFTTSNLGNGRSASVRVVGDASTRTLTFPVGWTWLGSGPPSSLAANDVGYLSITAYGVADTDVVAAWSYENAPAVVIGSGVATQVAYFSSASTVTSETAVGSNSFTWDATNNRLGVGTNTPTTAVDVATGQVAIPDGTAAAPALAFRDDLNTGLYSPTNDIVGVAVNGTEVARFQQSGAGNTPVMLMGTSTVYGAISVDSSDASGAAGVVMLAHAAAGTTFQEAYRGGQFAGVRSRGTKAAPTAVASGDGLVNMLGAGWTATGGINYGGLVTLKAEQAYTATASGGRVEIHTTLNGTDGFTTLGNTATERMRIANDGRVSVGQSGGSIIPAAAGSILTLAGGLTQSAGAVSLTGNAASSFTTSAGDLTLTGGVNLQLAAGFGSAVVVNEFASNVDFRVESQANANMLLVDASQSTVSVGTTGNTHTFNVGTGALSNFAVASGGRIHTYDGVAPTDGQVLIGDTALGNFAKAAITAGTGISVTNGAGSITIAATGAAASTSTDVTGYVAQQALNAGDLVRFVDDAGTPKVQKADATNTDVRLNPVGFAVAAALAGAAVTVRVAGVADVPAARFDAAPGVANVGQRVFVSTTSGQITLTAPSASGDVLQRAGVLVDGSGSPKVLVQVGDPTLL